MEPDISLTDIDGNRIRFEKHDRGWQFFSAEPSPVFCRGDMQTLASRLVSLVWNRPFIYALRGMRRTVIAAKLDVQEASTNALALADPKLQGIVPKLEGVVPKLQGVVELVDELGDAVGFSTRLSWPRRDSTPKRVAKPKKSRRPGLVDAWSSMIEAGLARHAHETRKERTSLLDENPEYRRAKARATRLRREFEQRLNAEQRAALSACHEASAELARIEDELTFRRTYRIAYTDAVVFMLGVNFTRGDHQNRETILAALRK